MAVRETFLRVRVRQLPRRAPGDAMKQLFIFGAGGFAREVFCLLVDAGKEAQVECFVEPADVWKPREINGLPVRSQASFDPLRHKAIIGVGDPGVRRRIVSALPAATEFETVIHPNVVRSRWVEIGEGSIICAGTILTCNIRLGKHTQLNLVTTIGHECTAGDFFTTAPAVNISGNCRFGDNVYFGANASIREKLTVCSDVTVGMGAVVVKDITEPGVYVGNPLRKLEKH